MRRGRGACLPVALLSLLTQTLPPPPRSQILVLALRRLTDEVSPATAMSANIPYGGRLLNQDQLPSPTSTIALGIALLYGLYQLLVFYRSPVPAPTELLWNAILYLIPARLLLDPARRQELRANNMIAQTQAAKGEALRRMLGFGSTGILQSIPSADGMMRRASFMVKGADSDVPPGLGNWDNSCYQNSVLQGLASLDGLKDYLMRSQGASEGTTTVTLRETLAKLNDANNNGRQLWTPAKLKSMSSWQQQDAQEYFSKIVDELEKEAMKPSSRSAGLEDLVEQKHGADEDGTEKRGSMEASPSAKDLRNPMEGLLAQRVACTRCGFSEGLSMIPFNCLTVPIGSNFEYDVRSCLDEYTNLEDISDVECGKCTLMRAEEQMKRMLPTEGSQEADKSLEPSVSAVPRTMALPPEVRTMIAKRLQAVQQALEDDDFDDSTLEKTCQIPKKQCISSTKTRQAVVGRAPQSLVIHVNRSVFDELTGAQRKNYARVRYPRLLDLGPWTLNDGSCQVAPRKSLLARTAEREGPAGLTYTLKAVVTHYGRHENGHYICYRQHPLRLNEDTDSVHSEEDDKRFEAGSRWWRLSDEDVSPVSEEDVLGQGGVFMLFYEREEVPTRPEPEMKADASAVKEPSTAAEAVKTEELDVVDETAKECYASQDKAALAHESTEATNPPELHILPEPAGLATSPPDSESRPSTATTTDDDSEIDPIPIQSAKAVQKPPTPPMMRTARHAGSSPRKKDGFGSAFRAVAAT